MTRGFLTPGFDLFRCEMMAHHLRTTQSEISGLSIMVAEGTEIPDDKADLFEHIVYYDRHENHTDESLKCHGYDCTPYDETILVNSDMLFPTDLDPWWELLTQDLTFSTTTYTYRNARVLQDPAWGPIKANRLPILSPVMMFFRKSEMTNGVFSMAKEISKHWDSYRADRLQGGVGMHPRDEMVFPCAVKEAGYLREVAQPDFDWFGFTDLRMNVQDIWDTENIEDDWKHQLPHHLCGDGSFVINQFLQIRPVCYRDPSFMTSFVTDVIKRNAA